jgi:hypothetical protein
MDAIFATAMLQKMDDLAQLYINHTRGTLEVEEDSGDLTPTISKRDIIEIFRDELPRLRGKNIRAILNEKLTRQQKLQGQNYVFEREREILRRIMKYIRDLLFNIPRLAETKSHFQLLNDIEITNTLTLAGRKMKTVLQAAEATSIDEKMLIKTLRRGFTDALAYYCKYRRPYSSLSFPLIMIVRDKTVMRQDQQNGKFN